MFDSFLFLLEKIAPLSAYIFLGFCAGRWLHLEKEQIAKLLIYLVGPVVIFSGLVIRPFSNHLLLIPAALFLISAVVAFLFLWLGRLLLKDNRANILAFGAGAGNTGYFGLPVAILLFGDSGMIVAVMGIIGNVCFENTIGFYLTARGQLTRRQSIKKMLRLPTLYAFIFGLLAIKFGFPVNDQFVEFIAPFRGSYTLLGMMMIGLGLSVQGDVAVDYPLTGLFLLARFFIYPLMLGSLVLCDHFWWHLFDAQVHQSIALISVLPAAANTVAFGTHLNVHPKKAAFAVLVTTVVGMIAIPLILPWIQRL